ncbi:MAG: isoprenoid biosynthesis glyoxalase ElbB [Alphaproteobacteria bacterium]
MEKKVKLAVVLSGCGVFDGSEIHEATLALLAINKLKAEYQCFAPDIEQHFVKNHYSKKIEPVSRNVLSESARIARGDIKPLTEYSVKDFDGIIFPGGFGAALNLCNFAVKGADSNVNDEVQKVIETTFDAQKPIGALCIAPALIARVLGHKHITVTIGNDEATAIEIEKTGAKHKECSATEICIDYKNKIITCPCYMLAQGIYEVAVGAEKTVEEIIKIVIDKTTE